MNKEKEIEELTSIIDNKAEDYIEDSWYIHTKGVAQVIIENGYGSVDRVRRETAQEILDEVSKHYGGAWLIELYKKYGVEVD